LTTIIDLQSKRIAVVNSSSWIRSGLVTIVVNVNGKSVKDASGKNWPLQKLTDGTYVFIANNVPALGTAVYTITNEEASEAKNKFAVTDHAVANDKVRIEWDAHGSITSLTEKDGVNFAGSFNNQGLNSYWYVPGLQPTNAITNEPVQVRVLENGPVVVSILMSSDAPGANRLERLISLDAGSNEVVIDNLLDKKAIREKEGVHFAFPFHSSLTKVTLDAGYGSMQYLTDQLPGSNMDYLYSRRWLDASNTDVGIQLMLLEAPLLEPGSIIDERKTINQEHKEWKTTGSPTATWFSYVMNNYWHTNYKADQQGMSMFHYVLKPHGKFNFSETEKACASLIQPLMAFPVKKDVTFADGLFELSNNRIVVTCLTPQQDGSIVIRLYNPEASAEETNFLWKKIQPSQMINFESGKKLPIKEPITLAGMGVMELKVVE
jgi:hypothetical protein